MPQNITQKELIMVFAMLLVYLLVGGCSSSETVPAEDGIKRDLVGRVVPLSLMFQVTFKSIDKFKSVHIVREKRDDDLFECDLEIDYQEDGKNVVPLNVYMVYRLIDSRWTVASVRGERRKIQTSKSEQGTISPITPETDASNNTNIILDKYSEMKLSNLRSDKQAIALGNKLFNEYCASCHEKDATGSKNGSSLRDDNWLFGGSAEAIQISIRNGRQLIMPPFEGIILNKQKVEEVATYVISLNANNASSSTSNAGKALYVENCSACHDASMREMIGAPNLGDDIWLAGRTIQDVISIINTGSNRQMPSAADLLVDIEPDRIDTAVRVLSSYVLTLNDIR